jgi:hypothetical protein
VDLHHTQGHDPAIAAAFAAVSLSACIVVPLNADGTPAYAVAPAPAAPVVAPPLAAPSALTLPVRLYPTNEAAAATGAIGGTVTNNLNGKGTFTLNVNGEALTGEATRTGGATSRTGVASAYGGKGSFANCQYTMNSSAQGTGRCSFSNGATYSCISAADARGAVVEVACPAAARDRCVAQRSEIWAAPVQRPPLQRGGVCRPSA